MIERISQSFVKTMREYLAGEECGNIVKYQYIDGKLLDRKSESMAQGSYFEFIFSTALPKGGKIPMPEYMATPLKNKTPDKLTVADMTVDYRRAHHNAAELKKFFTVMGLKIVKFGQRYVKGRFEGTIDLIVECQKEITFENGVVWKVGDLLVIDIKYSGLLYDKWEKFGWMFSDLQKQYHGTQAIQYHYITNLPFYFLVISNTNKEKENDAGKKEFGPMEMKLFRVPVDEHLIEMHIAEGNKLMEQLKFEAEVGLTPRPSFIRCSKCPLREICSDKHEFPHIIDIDLTFGV